METREAKGSASASEVPARAPGSGYNFRPRSRSAMTVPKDRRLGSVKAKGAGSTLDLPAAPPNSPSPLGGNNDNFTAQTTLIPYHAETPNHNLRNSTLVPTPGCEDPLPVPVDANDRPTLHDVCAKNDKNIAGKNNMAAMHDNDVDNDSTKLSQSNPLLGQVQGTHPTMSSDVTADNHPEKLLMFKAARDRFCGGPLCGPHRLPGISCSL